MPASLPGATRAENLANPSQGKFVIFDPLSGPKGSPLDAKISTGTYDANRVPIRTADPTNLSTGQLSTGIGIGANRVIAAGVGKIFESGYDDDFIPGQRQTYSAPPPKGNTATNTVDSTRMYIGGGRMIANGDAADARRGRPFIPSPYTAGISIVGAGNGGSRDAGAGPAFTGFEMKMVTAAGTVANGAAIEGTFANRSGVTMTTGQSAFGSSTGATAVPATSDPGPNDMDWPMNLARPERERDDLPKDQPRGFPPDRDQALREWQNANADDKDRLPGGGRVLIIHSEEDEMSVDEQRERAKRDDAENLERLERVERVKRIEKDPDEGSIHEGLPEDKDRLPGGGRVLIIHSEEDEASADEQREHAKKDDAERVERVKREEEDKRKREADARELIDRERGDAVKRSESGAFRADDRGRDDGQWSEEDERRDEAARAADKEREDHGAPRETRDEREARERQGEARRREARERDEMRRLEEAQRGRGDGR